MFDRLLQWSVKREYPLLTKLALWIGANPNVKDQDGNTLLHILVDSKNEERAKKIADILAKNKLNISATNKDEETALEYAARKSNSVMLSFFLGQDHTRRTLINTFIYKYHRHKALRRDKLKDKLIKLAHLRRTNPVFSQEDQNTVSNICATLKKSYQNQDDKKSLKIFIQYMNDILPILEAPKGKVLESSECPMLNIINEKLGKHIETQYAKTKSTSLTIPPQQLTKSATKTAQENIRKIERPKIHSKHKKLKKDSLDTTSESKTPISLRARSPSNGPARGF